MEADKKFTVPALWRLAFRPFFLFGALFAALSIGLWLAVLFGGLPYHGGMSPIIWHSHEMVYGFSTAIIAGFILTAVQNWSGKRGIQGLKLQVLFGFWALARLLIAFYPGPSLLVTIVDLAFFPLLGFFLFPYLKEPRFKVERVFFLYFAIFFTSNLLVHLETLGVNLPENINAALAIRLGLHTVILVILFIGGRVIPFFTESAISRSQPKTYPAIEVLSHASAWAFLITQFFMQHSIISAVVAIVTAIIQLIRLQGWYVPRLKAVPIIWVLHVAYLWLAIGFLLSGFSSLGLVPITLSVHAFTVGGIGSIIFGMMTRVSFGHTGRKLYPSKKSVAGYAMISLAALIRVFGPMFTGALGADAYSVSLTLAGVLWITAFGFFVFEYFPVLTQPRLDGRDG